MSFRDFQLSIYDRKSAARRFDTLHDMQRTPNLAQSLLKSQNAPIRHSGNRMVKIKNVADIYSNVLISVLYFLLFLFEFTDHENLSKVRPFKDVQSKTSIKNFESEIKGVKVTNF